MKRAAAFTTVMLTALLLASTANAAPIIVGVDKFAAATLITFDELASGTPVANQYAAQGVFFVGGIHATNSLPPLGISLTNGDPDASLDVTLNFGPHEMARVGFDILTRGPDQTLLTVSGYRNNVLTFTGLFVLDTKLEPTFFGIEDHEGINQIVINAFTDATHLDAGFVLNDLRVQVPEPVSLSLLGLGLAGIAIRRRRSRIS
jgi:hypothetical protein